MRRKFETEVQYLKYRVLKAIAKHEFNGTLTESITDIPKEIIPGPKPTTRCSRGLLNPNKQPIMANKIQTNG